MVYIRALILFLMGWCGTMVHASEINPSCRVVILLGPPGSGKGTQAAQISKMGLTHVSTGDLFREHLKNETPLGKKVKGYLSSGQLVPDAIVMEMLFDRLNKEDCKKGILLDGFPRTVPQAEALDKWLQDRRIKPIVIDLSVDDDVIIKRLSGRLICRQCNAVYNRYTSSLKSGDPCPACKGELYQRDDDKEEVVRERLRVYHEQTEPVIQYYEKKGLLHHVNGDRDPDVIFPDVSRLIN